MNASLQKLHDLALERAQNFRKAEAELLDILQKIDEKKVYRELGFNSLYLYALRALRLSESLSFAFISVARKSVEVPELKAEIQAGNLSVSKAKKITSVINEQNAKDWIDKAIHLPQRELEKEVARVNPKAATPEKATYVTENRLNLQLGVSEELMNQLKRVQDLLSSFKKSPASLEESIQEMTSFYLERKDPVEKAKRNEAKSSQESQKEAPLKSDSQESSIPKSKRTQDQPRRKPLPARVEHQVFKRDEGRCQFEYPDGSKCKEGRWVHIHHITPVSKGGQNAVENLTTLCSAHHRLHHSGERSSRAQSL